MSELFISVLFLPYPMVTQTSVDFSIYWDDKWGLKQILLVDYGILLI